MDITRLRHAIAVAEFGSFTLAAVSIPLSQPALSRSIKALETEYSIRIFERGGRGARLTPDGALFINRAEELIRRMELVDESLRGIASGDDVSVSFGMSAMSATMFLPALLRDLLHRDSAPRPRVVIGSSRQLRDLLLAGEIEFYVGSVPQSTTALSSPEPLRIERLPAVMPDLLVRLGHPLLAGGYTPEQLASYPVIAGGFVTDRDSLSDQAGLQQPRVYVDDYEILLRLAEESDAILLGSEALIRQRPDIGVARLPIDLRAEVKIYALVFRKDSQLSSAATKLSEGLARRISVLRSV